MATPQPYDRLSGYRRRKLRLEYEQDQMGQCCYCGHALHEPSPLRSVKITRELFNPFHFNHPVHLHHDHETGWTIGAIHAHCNAVAWEYEGK